ncbi:AraC family transcriptional regulator [Agrobacterium sp. rho-13.3]|uniref:AraC family transcriptional regulator n=1 Tax=Agrobacterium sp. rho-13.3 TaxID=3072980 RepID=UPI002A148A73|nr:AraC family transcriptional regulator [Agrobacterium sp. rho-13.3]MDX8306164.1 AraC family transcriptional regulator [Agrobacterium sp. rho-13.3]MDX8307505.1 AraC family transcriptional regulator [Agrobacterium sp. rho-13.3]
MTMVLSHSSITPSDPLSEVLIVLGARSGGRTRLEAAGEWALSFPKKERLKLVALLRGECWIMVPGQVPQRLRSGDVFLLGSSAHSIASDPKIEPIDGAPLYAEPGCTVVRLGGNDTVLMGASITFAAPEASFVIDALPGFLRLDRTSEAASAVSRTLDLLDAELGRGHIGGALVTTRLAEVLVVEAIRAYVAEQGAGCVGWIGALADPHIGGALRLMHGEIRHPWTVASLAARVGMSRSAFSARFAERVGRPPLDYLTQWRMLRARQLLKQPGGDTARIALDVGYLSQSAFGHAFKRAFGYSPKQASLHWMPEPAASDLIRT